MKKCELCKSAARIFCESDQASLCWDCDLEVHSANFLVGRHSRNLLCHVCQSPTAWNASGTKLGQTVSVCDSCVDGCEGVKDSGSGEEESVGRNDVEIETENEYDDDDGESDKDEDDEGVSEDEEETLNQVVPWSSIPPPPAASSSNSEESWSGLSDGAGDASLKRLRCGTADLPFEDDLGCSSSHRKSSPPVSAAALSSVINYEAAFVESLRPLKRLRSEMIRSPLVKRRPAGSRTTTIVESLKRFHE